MRIYLSDNKTLYVKPDIYEIYGTNGSIPYIGGISIQIKGVEQEEEIQNKITDAIANVLKEYEPLFAELPLKNIFGEKRRQVRESFDAEQALADVINVWDCGELSEEAWK